MPTLHPNDFAVNQAWIAFRLNDVPIRTEADGDFNVIGLMDAASCMILGAEFIPVNADGASETESERLLASGYSHKGQMPETLFIPSHESAMHLQTEAERHGITVVRALERDLLPFIGEARSGFRERFEEDRAH